MTNVREPLADFGVAQLDGAMHLVLIWCRRILALCAAVLSIAPPVSAQQSVEQTPAVGQSSPTPLRPGDVVRIGGSREADLRGDFPVDVSGNVTLPVLGQRNVTDIPAGELKRRLLAAYAEELRNQQVDVILLRRVTVLGAVNTPGVYLVDATVKLSQVLAMAGGTTREGTLKGTRVRRGARTVRFSDDSSYSGYSLASGDEIIVPERSWLARNGQFVIAGSLSALAIIAAKAF